MDRVGCSQASAGGAVQEPDPALCGGGCVSKAELAAVLNFMMCYVHFWIKACECVSGHDGVVGGESDVILGCELAFV